MSKRQVSIENKIISAFMIVMGVLIAGAVIIIVSPEESPDMQSQSAPLTTNTQPPSPKPITPTIHPQTSALTEAILLIPDVSSVDLLHMFTQDERTYIYGEVRVKEFQNTPLVADMIRNQSYAILGTAFVEVDVILNDGRTATDYIWDNQTDTWQTSNIPIPTSTSQPTRTPQPTVTSPPPTPQPRTPRPQNCATAVAMGLSPEQAAQWDHLDRDNDGVACHGD